MLKLAYVLSGVWSEMTLRVPTQWGNIPFTEVVVDSREVVPDALFVALHGERTDGHTFLLDVAKNGARGALVATDQLDVCHTVLAQCQRPWVVVTEHAMQVPTPAGWESLDTQDTPPASDQFLLIAVDSPLRTVQQLAAYHRQNLTPTVVGITGSVGKTSTKEVAASVLSRRFGTLKSKRSYNSEVTVPTTLLQLRPEHDAAVVELGMWAPGEIRLLASLARPHIGVVCNVGPSHMERMGSIEAIARAKAELVEALPDDGVAILNADDSHVAAMAQQSRARVFRYGTTASADLWADQLQSHGLEGISFRVHYQGETHELSTPLPGRHNVYTALAAVAVALVMGVSWDDIRAGLQDRAALIRLNILSGGTPDTPFTVLDDSYNASPLSVLAALNLLAECGTPEQRIAVLGDMMELGTMEEEGHRQVGRRVPEVARRLVCVGKRAQWIAAEAQANGMHPDTITVVDRATDAIPKLQTVVQAGDYVLVKGSRSVAMEQIVAALRTNEQTPETVTTATTVTTVPAESAKSMEEVL